MGSEQAPTPAREREDEGGVAWEAVAMDKISKPSRLLQRLEGLREGLRQGELSLLGAKMKSSSLSLTVTFE